MRGKRIKNGKFHHHTFKLVLFRQLLGKLRKVGFVLFLVTHFGMLSDEQAFFSRPGTKNCPNLRAKLDAAGELGPSGGASEPAKVVKGWHVVYFISI